MPLSNEIAHSMLTHNDNHETLPATNWPTKIPKKIQKILVHVNYRSYESFHFNLRNCLQNLGIKKNGYNILLLFSIFAFCDFLIL